MSRFVVIAFLALAACRPAASPPGPEAALKPPPGSKALAELVVAYAGDAGSPRTEAWRAFLAQHVREVRVLNVLDLSRADLGDADVLVVDGLPMSGHGDEMEVLQAPKGVTLDALSVPTVLVGGMGGMVSDQMELKLGWRHG